MKRNLQDDRCIARLEKIILEYGRAARGYDAAINSHQSQWKRASIRLDKAELRLKREAQRISARIQHGKKT